MIYVILYGGLGNQIFGYSAARVLSAAQNQNISLVTSSLSNKGNDILTIHKVVRNSRCKTIHEIPRGELNIIQKITLFVFYFLREFYRNNDDVLGLFKFEKFVQPFLNYLSLYVVSNGFIKLKIHGKKIFKNSYMEGHFQSPKYFESIADLLKNELIFEVSDQYLINGFKISPEIESVCVHVRRGDYLDDVEHNVCDKQYYLNAMKLMRRKLVNPIFYIFSDDKEWIRENFGSYTDCCIQDTYTLKNTEELFLMSSCNHFIISNSTFSWWAQFCGNYEGKIVIAPKKWYTTTKPVDMHSKDWTLL